MTTRLPFIQASLCRAIEAARKAGLRVTAIRPDGTLIVDDGDNRGDGIVPIAPNEQTAATSKWEDVEA
jgi:hypothetical protein